MVRLVNFNEGAEKGDIENSGRILMDTYRVFQYTNNPNKTKLMDGRPMFVAYRKLFGDDYALGDVMNKTNTIILTEVNECNEHCWYCFVSNDNKRGLKGRVKNTNQVFNEAIGLLDSTNLFKNYLEVPTDKSINVLRISGGEPSLPKFRRFIYDIIRKFNDCPDYCLGIDTNLSYRFYNTELINQSNVAMQLCLKGLYDKNFTRNTGMPGDEFVKALKNLEFYEKNLSDYSIYILDTVYDDDNIDIDNVARNLYDFIKRPEKVEVLQVELYTPTLLRLFGKNFDCESFSKLSPEEKIEEKKRLLNPKGLYFDKYVFKNAWIELLKENGLDYKDCIQKL